MSTLALNTPLIAMAAASYSAPNITTHLIPDTATRLRVDLARVAASALHWPLASQSITWTVEQSNDGGVTWVMLGSSTAIGGAAIDGDTRLGALSSWDITPLRPGVSRQVRLTVTPSAAIHTQGTVTAV